MLCNKDCKHPAPGPDTAESTRHCALLIPLTALGDHHKSEAWARIRSGGSAVLTHAHGRRRISVDLSSPRGRRAGWMPLRLSLSAAWAAPHLYVGRAPLYAGGAPSIRGQSPLYTWAEPPLYVGRAPSIRGQSPLYTRAEPPLYVGGAPLYTWAEPPLYVGGAPSIRGRSPLYTWAEPLYTWAEPPLYLSLIHISEPTRPY